MSIVLRNQLDASERSLRSLEEQVLADHHQAMVCYDVQELAASVAGHFEAIGRDVEHWQNDLSCPGVASRDDLLSLEGVWSDLYARLAELFDRTARLIRAVEATGFEVSGKHAFLAAWRDARGIASLSRDRVAAAAAQMRQRGGRSLGDVRDELWDKPVG